MLIRIRKEKQHILKALLFISVCLMGLLNGITGRVPGTFARTESTRAYAAEAVIPFSTQVKLVDAKEKDAVEETFSYLLEAQGDAPAPEITEQKISGEGSGQFRLQLDRVGVYEYTLRQQEKDTDKDIRTASGTAKPKYDTTVYHIVITVMNTDQGDYGIVVSAHKGSVKEEKAEIVFTNTYQIHSTSTGDPDPSDKPGNPGSTPNSGGNANGSGSSTGLTGQKDGRPGTGDHTPLLQLTLLVILSGLIAAVIIRQKRKLSHM